MRPEYSPFKGARHRELVDFLLGRGEVQGPPHVQLILSDLCNHSCRFCFPPGTPVWTLDGFVPIERVDSGDAVFDAQGVPQIVVRSFERPYEGSLVSLRVERMGYKVRATPNHKIHLWRNGVRAEVPFGDVRPGDLVVVPVPEVEGVHRVDVLSVLHEQGAVAVGNTEVRLPRAKKTIPRWIPLDRDFGRLCGYFLGDGHVSVLSNRPGSANLCWAFSTDEEYLHHDVEELVGRVLGDSVGFSRPCASSVQLTCGNSAAAQLFMALLGTGSHDKQPNPALTLGAPIEFVEGLFAGYAHSDGCLRDKSFSTVSLGLAMSVYSMCLRLGLAPTLFAAPGRPSQIKGRVIHAIGDRYTIRFRDISGRMFDLLSRGASMPREEFDPRITRIPGGVALPVREVATEEFSGTVYNIEVANSHTYIAGLFGVNNCAYRTPGYSSSQRFYEVRTGAGNLVRDREHPDRNYNPRRWIPTERALDLVNEIARAGAKAIQLTGGGEPTVHPHFCAVVNRIVRCGLEYGIVSNGSLLTQRPQMVRQFAKAAWIRISVDAGVPLTYSSVRGVPAKAFDRVWQGISLVREMRDKLASRCVIGVGFVVTPDNWREVEEAADWARRAGADNIRISAQFSPEGPALFAPFFERARQHCRDARKLATDHFAVFDRFGDRVEDLQLQAPDYPRCVYQNFTTYIGADLNLYRCCVYAYNDQGLLTSLKARPFDAYWLSNERVDAMARFDPRTCERCQFNGINRFLNYLTEPVDPPHANFV